MPKIAKTLTAEQVAKATTTITVGGAPGLVLQVDPRNASRAWVLRYMYGGKRHATGLGAYPTVTLKEARQRASDKLRDLRDGVSPRAAKLEAVRAATAEISGRRMLKDVGIEYIALQSSGWRQSRTGKSEQQWTNSLANYVWPLIGHKYAHEVTRADIVRVVGEIWLTKHETASRILGRLENIFDYAKAKAYCSGDNPAMRTLVEPLLPVYKKKKGKFAAADWADIPAFIKVDLVNNPRAGNSHRALRLCIMTAVRTTNVLGAVWGEFDLDAGLWIIPEARMKGEDDKATDHYVPLSTQAVQLLKDQRQLVAAENLPTDAGALVFPSMGPYIQEKTRGLMLSNNAMLNLVRDFFGTDENGKSRATTHGMRSAFVDWGVECTNHTEENMKRAIAHAVGSTSDRSYFRTQALMKRKPLMQEWADFIEPVAAVAAPPRAAKKIKRAREPVAA